jgi:hypothetical protein
MNTRKFFSFSPNLFLIIPYWFIGAGFTEFVSDVLYEPVLFSFPRIL